MLIFDDFLSDFADQIGFYNEIFLVYMALLIRSYHGKMNTMARSCQDVSQDYSKILPKSYQDIHGGSTREVALQQMSGHLPYLVFCAGEKSGSQLMLPGLQKTIK